MNFNGRGYGDNPKCIAEELRRKNAKIVWGVLKHYEDIPSDIRQVKYQSLRWVYEMCTSKIWINNCRFPSYVRKRKGQFYIQTWHGSIGAKMVEGDANMPKEYIRKAKRDSKNADLFLSGSKFVSKLYRKAFWYDGKILESGTPRLDAMIANYQNGKYISELKKKVFDKVGIKGNPKIIMYAPTFREGNDECYDIDYRRLLSVIKQKYGGEWVVFLRFHPNIADKMKDVVTPRGVIDVTGYPDLYELLPISDIVISDYSSTGFEAAMIKKPVFLYASDYDEYRRKERGLYFDLEDLPFPFARNNDELMKNIKSYSDIKVKKISAELWKIFGILETGKSAEETANMIMEVMEE